MTELETMQRAKMYIDKLANGIDPITDMEMAQDTILNNVRLARCFFYVSDILRQVIDNGGVIGKKGKKRPFTIAAEELSKYEMPQESLPISYICKRISELVNDENMSALKTTVITEWLVEKGFLWIDNSSGKSVKRPTEHAEKIGIYEDTRLGQYGEYLVVYYSPMAQQFILDNLPDMLKAADQGD